MQIYSISLSGVLSLQLHALNNEGSEGNQTLTRRYYIVRDGDSEPELVNGISGDMLKHIQAGHLHRIALADALSLSEGASRFDPDRVGYDIDRANSPFFDGGEKELGAKIAKILQRCAVSDLEGFMITEKKGQTLKRDSTVEFGTIVGIPDRVKTQSYFHAKYGAENPVPYNVQVSSGAYATVAHLEAFRIGYNPHQFNYSIDATERKKRLDALLKSVLYAYLQSNGAKRNTCLPHPNGFFGILSATTGRCPAPMVSPLDRDFRDRIYNLSETLNRIHNSEIVHLFPFENVAEFANCIERLMELAEPWEESE
ncbi:MULTISPECIES: DevR family CRISPR-associated autoregulator [Spirulina sp. CCY15215]|uniref:DevR family CRISPR-associated autoregulator n=1 Tax=Spirulina sp. CCY15215 TaxID=2767591 RepID=UPI0019515940|nr:DevR family CRISPR-associated autoregulator [Spirulina major]